MAMSNLYSKIAPKPVKRAHDNMSVSQTNAWMNGESKLQTKQVGLGRSNSTTKTTSNRSFFPIKIYICLNFRSKNAMSLIFAFSILSKCFTFIIRFNRQFSEVAPLPQRPTLYTHLENRSRHDRFQLLVENI
jgi:hypothetical protein